MQNLIKYFVNVFDVSGLCLDPYYVETNLNAVTCQTTEIMELFDDMTQYNGQNVPNLSTLSNFQNKLCIK